jgi:histidinol-phosphate/aromatic aminotransferase/cobyric acid decarboxylase-like protein
MDLVGTVPNLIVARTFSKAYGLAGLRLGCWPGRWNDALGAARAFALQRELAGAGLPATCA